MRTVFPAVFLALAVAGAGLLGFLFGQNHGGRYQVAVTQLEGQVQSLEKQRTRLIEQHRNAESRAAALGEELQTLRSQERRASDARDEARRVAKAANQAASDVTKALENSRKRIVLLEEEREALATTVSQQNQELSRTRAEVTTITANLNTAQEARDALNKELSTLKEREGSELDEKIATLSTELKRAEQTAAQSQQGLEFLLNRSLAIETQAEIIGDLANQDPELKKLIDLIGVN